MFTSSTPCAQPAFKRNTAKFQNLNCELGEHFRIATCIEQHNATEDMLFYIALIWGRTTYSYLNSGFYPTEDHKKLQERIVNY